MVIQMWSIYKKVDFGGQEIVMGCVIVINHDRSERRWSEILYIVIHHDGSSGGSGVI